VHWLDWEIKKRIDETNELNRVLQDGHVKLYNTREEIEMLKERNDIMKMKERDNWKVIMDLLALNNSIEQHVHYYKGSEPDKF